MEYLSGKELSNQIKEKVKEEVTLLTRKPHMVVLVNPNDVVYMTSLLIFIISVFVFL